MPGASTVAAGAEAARSLDTCPTPPWSPAASPEPGCGGGWRLGTLGYGSGEARWAREEERRAHFGVRQSPAPGPEGGELHCGKGAARRVAAGVAGPRAAPGAADGAGAV